MKTGKSVQFVVVLLIGLLLPALAIAGGNQKFKLKNLKNQDVELSALLENGPVILDFWATWCKPCIKALPKLNKLQKKYRKQGLTVVAINEDGVRSQAKVKPFIKSRRLDLTVVLDQNNRVMRDFQVAALPTTLLLNQQGDVVLKLVGATSKQHRELEAAVAAMFAPTASPEAAGN